jgi:ribonuclease-3 family protein
MSNSEVGKYDNLSPLVLAYIGDAIYEVYIRRYLIDIGNVKVDNLQKEATKFVSAKGQTLILNKLINNNVLTEEELDMIRRGRNSKSHKAPKNTDIITYKQATGFETLIGYLYLKDNINRIEEIIKEIIGE